MDNMGIWVEGFQSFKSLKSVKKGPTSKFERGQFEAWEKVELAKHEEPMNLEVSFLLPFFSLSFFLYQWGMPTSLSLFAFFLNLLFYLGGCQ
jgi:hypothetical protein